MDALVEAAYRAAYGEEALALALIQRERQAAEAKFPDQHLPQGTGPDVRPFIGAPDDSALWDYVSVDSDEQAPDALAAVHYARAAKATCQTAGTPENPDTWLKVIGEEFWEYAEAADPEHVKAELIQVGAMVLRALEDILREEGAS
jgi:hypothetical protein